MCIYTHFVDDAVRKNADTLPTLKTPEIRLDGLNQYCGIVKCLKLVNWLWFTKFVSNGEYPIFCWQFRFNCVVGSNTTKLILHIYRYNQRFHYFHQTVCIDTNARELKLSSTIMYNTNTRKHMKIRKNQELQGKECISECYHTPAHEKLFEEEYHDNTF